MLQILDVHPSRYEQGESLAGIIYIHRISDVRFTGAAVKNFKTLLAICGHEALCNVVIMTNMWGKVTQEVGTAREQELASDFFKPALDNGAFFVRHEDTTESAHNVIRAIMGKERVTLRIQKEIVDQGKQIYETAAGRGLRRELDKQVEKHLKQLKELQEMLEQTEADDRETQQELEQEFLRLREELEIMNRESDQPTWTLRGVMQRAIIVVAVHTTWVIFTHIYGSD